MRHAAAAALAVLLAWSPALAQDAASDDDTPETRAALSRRSPLGARLTGPMLQSLRCVPATNHDGDTGAVPLSGGPIASLRFRVQGGDTPELNGKCPEERAKAAEARDRAARLAQPCVRILWDGSTDKYGRPLVWEYTQDGREIMAVLIQEGLARAYDGTGPRGGWCPAPASGGR
jgi:endonuclease YncB( thermonuclease family)